MPKLVKKNRLIKYLGMGIPVKKGKIRAKENVIKIVMVDKSGNKAQKIFETSVDTEDPVVQISEIPSLTSRTNVSISGSVNEPVTIRIFVDTNVNESAVPSMIEGLNATKI